MTQENGKARRAAPPESVLHEYPAIGKYRVRVVRNETRRAGGTMLDVREYIQSETFEGFTRRGIRLGSDRELAQLQEALEDAATHDWFANPRPGNGAA